MEMVFLVILIQIVFTILFYLFKRRQPSGLWPYYSSKALTQPEQVLYFRLVSALPDCVVLAQVQLSRILKVKKGHSFNEWNNRINRMSLDFVICRKDFSVLAAIELDDKSHNDEKRIRADQKKDKALKDAGVRLVRWKVESMPDLTVIKEVIAGGTGGNSGNEAA